MMKKATLIIWFFVCIAPVSLSAVQCQSCFPESPQYPDQTSRLALTRKAGKYFVICDKCSVRPQEVSLCPDRGRAVSLWCGDAKSCGKDAWEWYYRRNIWMKKGHPKWKKVKAIKLEFLWFKKNLWFFLPKSWSSLISDASLEWCKWAS